MPRAKRLTEFEKGQIVALSSSGLSSRDIAEKIGRSKTVVNNFLSLKDNYGKKNAGGRPKALSSRDERTVLRLASTGKYSSTGIIKQTGFNVCRKTICNTIRRAGCLKYAAKLVKPPLLPIHKMQRLSFARETMTWDDQWLQVIFSDEKKWNLDGPDGWKYYWHDLRKEKEIFSKRQFGGASVMTWGCFSFNGVGSLAFLSGKMNSVAYKNVLEDHLLPNAVDLAGEKWVFQQDNAPIHNSALMNTWFHRKNIQVLEWPSRSPDLNPIENLWGDLARRIYSHGRQYSSTT